MTNRQIEELAKFCLDVSKLALGSWVFGLFTVDIGTFKIALMLAGLTFAILFFILGMKLFRRIQ